VVIHGEAAGARALGKEDLLIRVWVEGELEGDGT
jgi:hypothetical protein